MLCNPIPLKKHSLQKPEFSVVHHTRITIRDCLKIMVASAARLIPKTRSSNFSRSMCGKIPCSMPRSRESQAGCWSHDVTGEKACFLSPACAKSSHDFKITWKHVYQIRYRLIIQIEPICYVCTPLSYYITLHIHLETRCFVSFLSTPGFLSPRLAGSPMPHPHCKRWPWRGDMAGLGSSSPKAPTKLSQSI